MSSIMRRPLRRGLLAAGGTLMAAAVARKFITPGAVAQQPGQPMLPLDTIKPHAPTSLPSLSFQLPDGSTRTLDQYKGHGVLLNLWATWCIPCVAELPALDALSRTLAASGAEVLTVSLDRGGADTVRPFYAAHGIRSLPILLDPHSMTLRTLGLDGIPTTLLINPQGMEVARLQGPVDWTAPAAVQLVGTLIGQHPPS